MDTNYEHRNQPESVPDETKGSGSFTGEHFVAPDVPIVRTNTPRPLPSGLFQAETGQYGALQQSGHAPATDFPTEAPVAPPLPEEVEEREDNTIKVVETTPLPISARPEPSTQGTSEFLWLFEYGLEMDAAVLNSSERLKGLALQYGPAVLKGYSIAIDGGELDTGQVVATIVPDREPGSEVWGILYRIPRRLTGRQGDEPSLLDKVHAVRAFEPIEVVVHEVYRKREVKCITYIASAAARQQLHLLPRHRQMSNLSYAQDLVEIAKRHKLPKEYVEELVSQSFPKLKEESEQEESSLFQLPVEQNTEPLPIVRSKMRVEEPAYKEHSNLPLVHSHRWLTVFALYLMLSMLIMFILSVIQATGYWSEITVSFGPLGIPWYVLVYGLLGGCVSCIVRLEKRRPLNLPGFVILTWFTRPYIGALLGALSYLMLNSGFFIITGNSEQHYTLFSLAGALAGFCEGWLFFR